MITMAGPKRHVSLNNRNMTDIQRFVFAMRHIVGRRLTYNQLIGKSKERSPRAGNPNAPGRKPTNTRLTP
jgi:hypothetical protein